MTVDEGTDLEEDALEAYLGSHVADDLIRDLLSGPQLEVDASGPHPPYCLDASGLVECIGGPVIQVT